MAQTGKHEEFGSKDRHNLILSHSLGLCNLWQPGWPIYRFRLPEWHYPMQWELHQSYTGMQSELPGWHDPLQWYLC